MKDRAARALRGQADAIGAPPPVVANDTLEGVRDALTALVRECYELGETVSPDALSESVRGLLATLEEAHGGRTIEVRVPPVSAVQLAAPQGDGPVHRRGTPPNVVETDPETFFKLATGLLTWDQAIAAHAISHSGAEAGEVAALLPITGHAG
jgi:hypothetical protein